MLARLDRLSLRRLPITLVVAVVVTSICLSLLTDVNLVPPELRYGFYAIAGTIAGMWLLAQRVVRSPLIRIGIATVAAGAALPLVSFPSQAPDTVALPAALSVLLVTTTAWFSFLRHLEDEARRVGGWRLLARPSRSRTRD